MQIKIIKPTIECNESSWLVSVNGEEPEIYSDDALINLLIFNQNQIEFLVDQVSEIFAENLLDAEEIERILPSGKNNDLPVNERMRKVMEGMDKLFKYWDLTTQDVSEVLHACYSTFFYKVVPFTEVLQ